MTLQDTGARPATTDHATASDHAATAAAHAAWRAAREDDLRTPHGWLSLVGYLDVPHTPTVLGDVPGRWWVDGDQVHHALGADVTTHAGAEGGSQVVTAYLPAGRATAGEDGTAEVAVELVRRTGRFALRLRDPHAPARRAFTGVPAYDHDASWVLDVPVRWYPEPREVVVGAARPGLVHRVRVVGEVDVARGGRRATLALTAFHGDAVALLFSDEATDVAPWRLVLAEITGPGAATVRLDLNRATNLPYAFSEHGTCPAPVPGNHLPFAVTAGERVPR